MYAQVVEFSTFVAKWADASTTGFEHYTVYEDKSLFKAKGPVWHKTDRAKNEIPKGLRNLSPPILSGISTITDHFPRKTSS